MVGFGIFIVLEVYIVYHVDIYLKQEGINISWLLWTVCGLIIIYEVVKFSVAVVYHSIIRKIQELFRF